MEIVTHVLTSEQHLDDGRKKTVRQNIEAASDADLAGLVQVVAGKVDKEEGKGLSTNDYTDEEKSKLGDAFNDCHTHENKDLLDGIESYVSGVEKSQDGKTLTIHQTTGETVSDVSFSGELNRIETVTQNGTPLDIVNKTVEITETVQTVSVNGIELPNDGHNIDIGVASPDGSVTVTSGEHGVELSATVYKGDSPINVNEDRISLDPSAITTIEETETIHVRQETNPAGNAVFKLDVDANAGKSYTGESPVQVDNVTNQIGIMKSPLRFEAPIKGTLSPTSLTIGLDYTKAKSMGRIYASVADAVADAANLSVGEYFETNGFHARGDGGAARYLVSDTGTANGMDLVQLAAGKLAILQINFGICTLEQLGYIPSEDDSNYIEPYINRVLSLPVSTLQLQTGTYFFHTNILIKKNGFTLRGLGSGKTTIKQVSPGLFGLQFEYRELTLEGFTLAGPSDGVGICTRLWTTNDSNVSHYNYTFKNLVVTGFRNGFELGGQVKWQTKFDNVRVSLCYNGISLVESGFCYEFNRVMTDRCENAGLYVFGQADALFNNCNFGSISSGVRIVPWSYGTTENPYYESTLLFNGCNFELDREVSPCPGAFVYVSDGLNVNLNFASCRFTWGIGMKLVGNYGLSLGDQCCIKIDSCEIFVNTDNALVSNFFDPSRNPKKKVGSVIISGNSRCSVKSRMPQWSFPEPLFGSKFKPTLINFSKSGIAHYDDSTNFLQNYGGTSNGTMLYNDSDNCLYTFINGTLCKLTHQQGGATNTIYIYNKLYTFVKIGKLLWLTENLDIPTENSVPITNYGSGQYYPIDDYESLAEYIPLDWRLPTRAECRDSLNIIEGVSPNAKKCCSTAYPSIWPTATNEYGLSMLPNGNSESVDPTRAFWWTSSKGGSDDKTPVYFGVDDVRGVAASSYTVKIPIRLVRVAG